MERSLQMSKRLVVSGKSDGKKRTEVVDVEWIEEIRIAIGDIIPNPLRKKSSK